MYIFIFIYDTVMYKRAAKSAPNVCQNDSPPPPPPLTALADWHYTECSIAAELHRLLATQTESLFIVSALKIAAMALIQATVYY